MICIATVAFCMHVRTLKYDIVCVYDQGQQKGWDYGTAAPSYFKSVP